MEIHRKRKRKDISCVSKRHLTRLAAQESEIVSDVLHDISSYNIDNNCTKKLTNDCTVNSATINIDNKMECNENNEIFVQYENDALKQSEYNTSDSQQSSVNISYNDSSDVAFETRKDSNLQHDLAIWAIEHQIKHTALEALLHRLKKHSCFSTLSVDARSFLKTPRQYEIRTVVPGLYHHFGLSDSIRSILTSVKNINCVRIAVNIDGLPLSKSSQQQFWPILDSVLPYNNVFIIGIYHGNEKPASANEFLQDFLNEAKEICANGIDVNGRNIPCRIEALICDAPAKAFVLNVKGHTGYSSCTKCITEGEYVGNRMCFPQIDAPLRSDNDFIQKIDDSYHKPGTCSLLDISYFKPVTNVPLDYMHLICLGIMRKLLNLWLDGELHYRLQHRAVNEISIRLVTQLKPWIPIESKYSE